MFALLELIFIIYVIVKIAGAIPWSYIIVFGIVMLALAQYGLWMVAVVAAILLGYHNHENKEVLVIDLDKQ